MWPVEGLIEAAEGLAERFKGSACEEAASADVHEARSLNSYIRQVNWSSTVPEERCLYTFLFILRLGFDSSIPAPDSLRDFSRKLFNSGDPFPGVDDDEDIWLPLENLWRNSNQGKVCPRSSELRWLMIMRRPRKPYPRPRPLLFESGSSAKEEDKEDSRRPCGWGCKAAECLGVEQAASSSSAECRKIFRGWWPESLPPVQGTSEYSLPPARTTSEYSLTCTVLEVACSKEPDCCCETASSNADCWNIFDLVERLVHQDCFFSLPVHNLGWNLRTSVQRNNMDVERLIDEAYSKAKVENYVYSQSDIDRKSLLPFRVREAKRLIRGLHRSPFLQQLLLFRPPNSTLPLFYSLAAAAGHARLWLFRAHLPVHLGQTLTYAAVCTPDESEDSCDVFLEERGPSILEFLLRSHTLGCFWYVSQDFTLVYSSWAGNGMVDIRVATRRPGDFEVPEKLLQQNEKLWKMLARLPCPMLVSSAEGVPCFPDPSHRVRNAVVCYLRYLELETKVKAHWLGRVEYNFEDVCAAVREAMHPVRASKEINS